MPSGWRSRRARSDRHASATRRAPAWAVTSSHSGRRSSATSHPAAASAPSTAASMAGSASTRRRPTRRPSPAHASSTVNPGSRRAMPVDEPGHVPGHRADGVDARRQGPDAVGRDSTPGRLEPGRAAAGRGDPHRPAGVAPVGDVGLVGGHRHGAPARRPAGDQRRIEGVHRGPVPRVDPRDPERQLVEIGPPDDPRPRGTGPGQARSIGAGGDGRLGHGPAARGRGHAGHVDEVLDRQPDPGPGRRRSE